MLGACEGHSVVVTWLSGHELAAGSHSLELLSLREATSGVLRPQSAGPRRQSLQQPARIHRAAALALAASAKVSAAVLI